MTSSKFSKIIKINIFLMYSIGLSQTQKTWFSGDVHSHLACTRGDISTPNAMLASAKQHQVNVTHLLVHGWMLHWADNFKGQEIDPISEPENIIQWGVEISGLPGDFNGHMDLLNVAQADAVTVNGINYPGKEYMHPNYDYIQKPGGLIGFDHAQFWPTNYNGGDVNSPNSLPFDILFHKVDFLSTNVNVRNPGFLFLWYGMLDAGFHLTPAAGSDYPCYDHFGRIVTVIPSDSSELSIDTWINTLRMGRTLIRDNNFTPDYLDMRVNGSHLGADLYVNSNTSSVSVEVEASSPMSGTDLEILVNGEVIQSEPLSSNIQTHRWDIALTQSSWIAARTQHAHTAATYVLIGGCPVRTDAVAARRWKNYMDIYFNKFESRFGSSRDEVQSKVVLAKNDWEKIAQESEGTLSPSCQVPIIKKNTDSRLINQMNNFLIKTQSSSFGKEFSITHSRNLRKLEIFNSNGKRISTLHPSESKENSEKMGSYFIWRGKSDKDESLPAGIYLITGSKNGQLYSTRIYLRN